MRPLELTVYDEYHGAYSRQQMIDGINHISFHKPKPKRFTDAELAAEYWRAEADMATEAVGDYIEEDRGKSCTWSLYNGDVFDRGEIFHRFATHPHYSAAD